MHLFKKFTPTVFSHVPIAYHTIPCIPHIYSRDPQLDDFIMKAFVDAPLTRTARLTESEAIALTVPWPIDNEQPPKRFYGDDVEVWVLG